MVAFISAVPVLPSYTRAGTFRGNCLPGRSCQRVPKRSRIAFACAQTPAQQTPKPNSAPDAKKPRPTLLTTIIFLSATLWSVAILPIMLILFPLTRFLRSQRTLLARLACVWQRETLRSVFLTPTISGVRNIPKKPCIFVSNHQSPLDTFFLSFLKRPLINLIPARAKKLPPFGWICSLAGWVGVGTDRRAQLSSLISAVGSVSSDFDLAMFPEGVPSESGVMRRFGSPIFKMAQKDDIEVVPVTINGSGKLCENGIPVRRGKVEIHVHPPIVMKGRTVMEITNAAHSVVRGGLPAELRVEE